MKTSLTKKIISWRIVNILLIVLVIFFISRFVISQWDSIATYKFYANYKMLAAGFIIFELYWVYQIYHWRSLMQRLGEKTSFLTSAYFYFSSCLLAYIPGKISNVIGIASIAKHEKIRKDVALTTVVLFQIYSVISGVAAISLLWFLASPSVHYVVPNFWIVIFWMLALIGLISISPPFLAFSLKLVSKILKKDIMPIKISYIAHMIHLLIYFISWNLLALAIFLLANSFGETLPLAMFPSIELIFLSSYLMGLVIIIIPAGLGVVELGLLYGFRLFYHPAQAMFASVSFRLFALFTVFFSFFFVIMIKRLLKRS